MAEHWDLDPKDEHKRELLIDLTDDEKMQLGEAMRQIVAALSPINARLVIEPGPGQYGFSARIEVLDGEGKTFCPALKSTDRLTGICGLAATDTSRWPTFQELNDEWKRHHALKKGQPLPRVGDYRDPRTWDSPSTYDPADWKDEPKGYLYIGIYPGDSDNAVVITADGHPARANEYRRLGILYWNTLLLEFAEDCPEFWRDFINTNITKIHQWSTHEYPTNFAGYTVLYGARLDREN